MYIQKSRKLLSNHKSEPFEYWKYKLNPKRFYYLVVVVQDVVPFDATRVVLEKPLSIESNGELSNYINASLISDLSGQVHSPL